MRLQFGFLSGGGITAAGINFGAAACAIRPECIAPESNPAPGAKYHTHSHNIQYPRSGVWNNERGAIKKKGSRVVSFSSHAKHIKEIFSPLLEF